MAHGVGADGVAALGDLSHQLRLDLSHQPPDEQDEGRRTAGRPGRPAPGCVVRSSGPSARRRAPSSRSASGRRLEQLIVLDLGRWSERVTDKGAAGADRVRMAGAVGGMARQV